MSDDQKAHTSQPTRRTFLLTTGSSAAATVIATCVPADATSGEAVETPTPPDIPGAIPVVLRINGK